MAKIKLERDQLKNKGLKPSDVKAKLEKELGIEISLEGFELRLENGERLPRIRDELENLLGEKGFRER